MTKTTHRAAWRAAMLPVALVGLLAACGTSDDASDTTTDIAAAEEVLDTAVDTVAADEAVADEAVADTAADDTAADEVTSTEADTATTVAAEAESTDEESDTADTSETGASSTFSIDVWADNWSAVYVNGELIGEDSVPITTERSFNSETFTFEATYPFTLAIEAKDFKETDSGIEYIGEQNQQMGDGGIIAQVIDTATGEVVAGTDGDWTSLVIQEAPLNVECADDPDPDATCEFYEIDEPADWAATDFDDSAWTNATVWSAADVSPKDGYDEISWDPSAELIWGTDLETDNTILLRTTVS